jgi:hypothetical protein
MCNIAKLPFLPLIHEPGKQALISFAASSSLLYTTKQKISSYSLTSPLDWPACPKYRETRNKSRPPTPLVQYLECLERPRFLDVQQAVFHVPSRLFTQSIGLCET